MLTPMASATVQRPQQGMDPVIDPQILAVSVFEFSVGRIACDSCCYAALLRACGCPSLFVMVSWRLLHGLQERSGLPPGQRPVNACSLGEFPLRVDDPFGGF